MASSSNPFSTPQGSAAPERGRSRSDGQTSRDPRVAASSSVVPAELKTLHGRVRAIRAAVAKEGAATLKLWRHTLAGSPFAPAAENLAHYLALRRRDLSSLQPALAAYGLSSLGRSEAHVLTALDALVATLGRLCGHADNPYPGPAEFDAGAAILRREQERIFGRSPGAQHTRIMVTLPTEAGDDPALVQRLIGAGMNCARINCAHDDPAVWTAMISNIRAASRHL